MRDFIPCHWGKIGAVVLLLLGGGASADPPQGGQGRWLHGTGRFEHVNIPLDSIQTPQGCQDVMAYRGALYAPRRAGSNTPCKGVDFNGATFTAPFAGRMVVFKVANPRPHKNIYTGVSAANEGPWEYEVTYEMKWGPNPDQMESGKLCATPGNVALVVPHAWSASGELISNDRYFTFACVPEKEGELFRGGGVIAKCIDWGYPPWNNAGKTLGGHLLKGKTKGGVKTLSDSAAEALQFHQVCVRMATADYCGEGKANTLDGTPIAFVDVIDVPTTRLPVGKRKEFHFEAAWGIDSCGKVRAMCLSKKRWATFSLDGTCIDFQNAPPQPTRYRPHGEFPTREVFCEDFTESELEEKGALLFTYSTLFDVALTRFRKEGGGGVITTTATRLINDGDNHYVVPTYELDKSRINVQEKYVFEGFEGPILSKNLPVELKQKLNLKPLYRCRKGSSFLTTVPEPNTNAKCPQGYALDGTEVNAFEGYLYAGEPRIHPLYLWKDAQGNYATSTRQPPGYTQVPGEPLGYLPPMGQLAEAVAP